MSKQKCLVVIPTHKERPDGYEAASFLNTIDVLRGWEIRVILPANVSGRYYQDLANDRGLHVETENLVEGFLGSIANYNRMATSADFYRSFDAFDYILIVHLDAWVFRDDLEFWINKNFDYVGAPFVRIDKKNRLHILPSGGNGGLCLRNVTSHIRILERREFNPNLTLISKWILYVLLNFGFYLRSTPKYLVAGLLRFKKSLIQPQKTNEDILFSISYPLYDKSFKVAPPGIARDFALDEGVDKFAEIKTRPPMGIHGFHRNISAKLFKELSSRK